MTEKVFWQDPYLTHFDTTITSVDDARVTVAQTIFYAFAGGQESDVGTIGNRPVLEARKDGLEIYYSLSDSDGLRPGMPVAVDIDWVRRYRLMRLHFAAEIVLELTNKTLPGIEKIGAHIASDKSRIDFSLDEPISKVLPQLQEQSNALIAADLPIVSAFSDEANERRYWEIDGFARVACGGTHIRRTGEVGLIRLKRNNIGKGKERIEIFLAEG